MSRKGDDDGFRPHPGDPWHPGWSSEGEAAPDSAADRAEPEVSPPASEPSSRRRLRRERGRKGGKAKPVAAPGSKHLAPSEGGEGGPEEVVEPAEDEVLPPGWWATPPAEEIPRGARVEGSEEPAQEIGGEAESGEGAEGAARGAGPLFPWWSPAAPEEPPAVPPEPPPVPSAEVAPEVPGYSRGAASVVPLDLGQEVGLPAEPVRLWGEPAEEHFEPPDAAGVADEAVGAAGPEVEAEYAEGAAEELERAAAALAAEMGEVEAPEAGIPEAGIPEAEIGEILDVAPLPDSIGDIEAEEREGFAAVVLGEEITGEETPEAGTLGGAIAAEPAGEEIPAEQPRPAPRGPEFVVPFPEAARVEAWPPPGEEPSASEGPEAMEGEWLPEGEPLDRQGRREEPDEEPFLSPGGTPLWLEAEPSAGEGEASGAEGEALAPEEAFFPPAPDLGLEASGLVLASWEAPDEEGPAVVPVAGEAPLAPSEEAGPEEEPAIAETEIADWLAFVEGVPPGGTLPGRIPVMPAVPPPGGEEPPDLEEAAAAEEAPSETLRKPRRGWFRRRREQAEEEAAAGPAPEPVAEETWPQPPPWAPGATEAEVEAAQVEAARVEAAQVEATQAEATQAEAAEAESAPEEGVLFSADDEEIGTEAAWAAWEAGDERARPGAGETGRLPREEPAPAPPWPTAPRLPETGGAPAGYPEPVADSAEPAWEGAEWAGEPAEAAAAWYAEVDEDEVEVPPASLPEEVLPEDAWEAADEGWAAPPERPSGGEVARPPRPAGTPTGAPLLEEEDWEAEEPAMGWAEEEGIEPAALAEQAGAAREATEEPEEELEEEWGEEPFEVGAVEAEVAPGVPSAEELEAEGWERFPEPGEPLTLPTEGSFPAGGPSLEEPMEGPGLEGADWETFPEPGVQSLRWPQEPAAAGPVRFPVPERQPVFSEDRADEAYGAEEEPWLPDQEGETYSDRPAAASSPDTARAARVDEPTMEIPPPEVYDFEGTGPRRERFGEGTLGGGVTMEHRGLAEEVAAADTAETELQALSAPMAGLESGVVGFEDVAHLGGEEEAGVPARSDLPVRVATGMVLAALLLGSLWVGGEFLAGFVGLMVFLGLAEFYGALRRRGYQPLAVFGLPAGIGILVGTWFYGLVAIPVATVAAAILTFFYYAFAPHRRDALTNGGLTVLGALWVTGSAAFAFPIAASPDFRLLILAVAATVIATDVGAFFAGRAWGSRPMAPVLSPRKTWEGLAGGVVLGIGAAVAMGYFFDEIGIRAGTILGLVVAVMAPLGDLAESMVKRSLGVKDMGAILPGHGGILDRVDAFLFVLPAAWVLFETMGLLR